MAMPLKTHCTTYFLPQNIQPQFSGCTDYFRCPHENFDSYEAVLIRLQKLQPHDLLKNVSLKYSAEYQAYKDGVPYISSFGTTLYKSTVSVSQFLEFLECCNPKNRHSIDTTKQCWEKVDPKGR